jgi:solute carrier family 45 protein 1/2/4
MYGWAPLAILGEEIIKLGIPNKDELAASLLTQNFPESLEEEMTELEHETFHTSQGSTPSTRRVEPESTSPPSAGVYLGIWNIYATIPQFVATFIAVVAFRIMEPGKGIQGTGPPAGGPSDGTENHTGPSSGTATCLAIGAVCSCVAAALTFRLRKF